MSLLVIPVILGLFVYTWTVDEKYSRRNSERIYGNQFKWNYLTNNTFSQFFAPFQKSRSIFKHLDKTCTLIAYVFVKVLTLKDVVRKRFKKPRFRTSFDSPHATWSQTLLNSAGQHYYHILSSHWEKESLNIFFLVTS